MPERRPYTNPMIHRTLGRSGESLAAATAELEELLARASVGPEASYACTLALEEIVTNIVKYGHDDRGDHPIRFSAELTPDHVVLRFADDGRPFNPLEAAPPDLARPL